jgi:nucleoside triphosphate diphosphatase
MAPRKSRRKLSKCRKESPRRKTQSKRKSSSKIGGDFEKLVAVMARLRAPGGCPWDREQTHATLRTYLIEEAYEVLDALDSTDDAKFAEELGDLLLQVLFHAQIAREEHRFSITDVIREIHDKMVRRHPHVFGTSTAKTAADVLRNWEQIKQQERAAKSAPVAQGGSVPARHSHGEGRSPKGFSSPTSPATQGFRLQGNPKPTSYLDGVPRTLPALLEALQLTRKAARVGFDWPNVDGIFGKLQEETQELQAVLAHSEKNPARLEGELGDILFVAVNLARFLHVDPELALKKTSAKFTRRFHQMEQFAHEQGTTLAQISRDQLESLWDRCKLLELSSKS